MYSVDGTYVCMIWYIVWYVIVVWTENTCEITTTSTTISHVEILNLYYVQTWYQVPGMWWYVCKDEATAEGSTSMIRKLYMYLLFVSYAYHRAKQRSSHKAWQRRDFLSVHTHLLQKTNPQPAAPKMDRAGVVDKAQQTAPHHCTHCFDCFGSGWGTAVGLPCNLGHAVFDDTAPRSAWVRVQVGGVLPLCHTCYFADSFSSLWYIYHTSIGEGQSERRRRERKSERDLRQLSSSTRLYVRSTLFPGAFHHRPFLPGLKIECRPNNDFVLPQTQKLHDVRILPKYLSCTAAVRWVLLIISRGW